MKRKEREGVQHPLSDLLATFFFFFLPFMTAQEPPSLPTECKYTTLEKDIEEYASDQLVYTQESFSKPILYTLYVYISLHLNDDRNVEDPLSFFSSCIYRYALYIDLPSIHKYTFRLTSLFSSLPSHLFFFCIFLFLFPFFFDPPMVVSIIRILS